MDIIQEGVRLISPCLATGPFIHFGAMERNKILLVIKEIKCPKGFKIKIRDLLFYQLL